MAKDKKIVVLKDIVIPAGTIMVRTPDNRQFASDGWFECTVGLSKDTCGDFTYCLDDANGDLDEYFAEVK
jgi:hypothetical protein